MNIKIKEKLFFAMGGSDAFNKNFKIKERWYGYRSDIEIDLQTLSAESLDLMEASIQKNKSVYGAQVVLRDIATWRKILKEGATGTKPRSVQQFSSLLKVYLRDAPGHRLYKRGTPTLAYYVSRVKYVPEQTMRDWHTPAHCIMSMAYVEYGVIHEKNHTFWANGCNNITLEEALMRAGYTIEDDELREAYLASDKRFHEIHKKFGLQMLAVGLGRDVLDGNSDDDDDNRWRWWAKKGDVVLEHGGRPARVLVDVHRESQREEKDKNVSIDHGYWGKIKLVVKDGDEVDDDEEDSAVGGVERQEIPVHPFVPCFDLRRHLRLSINIDQLELYEYDATLGEKLVLPDEVLKLVEVLVSSASHSFTDVIADKGGGTTILCAGPAGTGKTLTAEVYSETKARPLYTVQCSQLGTHPDDLEKALNKIFARALRWNAILLLDEADVYIMSRGDDLVQNAIVGVFLRMLEYYAGTLFMTTNRSDLVDDAISSRCIARIDYKVPPIKHQRKLWRILSTAAGVPIPTSEIEALFKEKYTDLTGRDIKNLIKLAKAVSMSSGKPVTAETIRYVRQFKPTNNPTPKQEMDGDDGKE